MPGCIMNLTVRYANGQVASFCSVSVAEVFRILWGEFERWVTTKTANASGVVSFNLDRGKKYHFVFRVPGKEAHVWQVMDRCPIYMGAQFPS